MLWRPQGVALFIILKLVLKKKNKNLFCFLRVCVRSRCWDACMVIDGGTSFEFNDGAIATISMSEEDQLRTVVLEN